MGTFVGGLVPVLAAAFGVAAIAYGEADDAPGLVLFGLLIVGGATVFGLRPSLRSKTRVIGFIVAAIVLTVVGSLTAGWLENNF